MDDAEHLSNAGDEEQDENDADVSNNNLSEIYLLDMGEATPTLALASDNTDRRATFTFSVEADQSERETFCSTEPQSSRSQCSVDDDAEQEATLMRLFRSPLKEMPPTSPTQTAESVEYPELRLSGGVDTEMVLINEVETAQMIEEQPGPSMEDASFEATTDAPEDQDVSEEAEHRDSEPEGLDKRDSVVDAIDVSYPALPVEESLEESAVVVEQAVEIVDEVQGTSGDSVPAQLDSDSDDAESEIREESTEEDFTEASLQLNIQREVELELKETQQDHLDKPEEQQPTAEDTVTATESEILEECMTDCHEETGENNATAEAPVAKAVTAAADDDITSGLTLGPSVPSSREPTPRKLRSPSPPPAESGPDDATMTLAFDDDTAVLKDFLSRAAASKASKAAIISRRESLQNRRDSDVVRHALASPRKVLEDKDPNSPSKYDNDATLDLSQTLTLTTSLQAPSSPNKEQTDVGDAEEAKATRTSRRSSRTRKTRLPAPSSAQQTGPSKIAVRRADGGEPIVLKKTDAQELSLMTRANTRKNKQGSVAVSVRLLKLASEARSADDSTIESVTSPVQMPGKKYVRWDEQLAYFQEGTDTMANMLADAESLATPDELSLPAPVSTPSAKPKQKASKDKNATPKIRRVRGLGTANGTPGKGLLAPASLLPDAVQEEREAAQAQSQCLPKPKSSRVKKMPVASSTTDTTPAPASTGTKLPALEIAPMGVEPIEDSSKPVTKERKSKLATPRKVKLPPPASSVHVDGKENQQKSSIAAATPKKGIPMPSVVVPPSMGMETGLPRRRARKL